MEAVINKIQNILENEYSNENFVTLVKEIFPEMQLVAPDKFNEEFSNFSSYVDGYIHIGNYTTPDNKKILILAIQLKNAQYVENSRSAQRNFAKRLIENNHCDASFIAFYTKPLAKRIDETETLNDKDSKWRISFVKIDYSINFDNGKLKMNKNLTPAKRYSYLVGKGEPSHTAIKRIRELIVKKNELTINDIENAFSVEKVTDEFFKAYAEKFNDLNEYLSNNDDFKYEALRLGLNPKEFSVQFSKKLLGQIVFLYFLQKKGWLGVNAWPSTITEKEFKHAYYDFDKVLTKNYIPKLYINDNTEQGLYRLNTREFKNISQEDEAYLSKTVRGSAWGTGPRDFMRKYYDYAIKRNDNKNFYDDYLEPLFYDALNKNRGDEGYWAYFHCRIPFLSGSLFEPINNYDWQHSKFSIPNEMFSNKKNSNDIEGNGILDIFDRYNFTISEDEPMEKEVAIDPEMLGKVFENMLELKDRKSKGAFYTPREIVHYMCQESLINYLTNNTGISQKAIRDFILYGEYIKSEDTNKKNNIDLLISKEIYQENPNGEIIHNRLKEIDDLLANIKVADPAVGSGAFPLGMLNEIVKARTTITEYMYKYENPYNKRIIYTNERSIHKLKLETIKNSIFAVDIEPSAVDITKLRLWLSLVIDDDINPNAQTELEGHKNPLPLPNLECNILCGNSLIDEFEGVKLLEKSNILGVEDNISFSTSTFNVLLEKLLNAEDKLFSCSNTDDKIALKKEIEDIKYGIIKSQMVSNGNANEEVLAKLSKVRTISSRPFIVWQLDFTKVFRDNKGFDIVIGNPPYVGEKNNKDIFRAIANTNFGKRFYMGKTDLFYFFFHKGIDIARKSGIISYITTNYYITANGAKILRNDFYNRTKVLKLINFGEYKIFESALGQHNMITFLEKQENADEYSTKIINTNRKGYMGNEILSKILNENDLENTEYYYLSKNELFDSSEKYIRLYNNSDNGKEIILNKIKENNDNLSEYCNISSGADITISRITQKHINTFGNKYNIGEGVFVVNHNELKSMHLNEKENLIIKDFIKNSNICKYGYELYNEKLIYLNWEDDIEQYPNIKKHLEKYKEILEDQAKRYNEHYPWFALHRPRELSIFEADEKILVPYRTKTNIFGYSKRPIFASRDVFFITKKRDVSLKYILGLLNSKVYLYWLINKGKRKGETLELYGTPLSEIPIKIVNDVSIVNNIENKVNEMINKKAESFCADISVQQKELDSIIYKLFDFNDKEISIIENECVNYNI